jgi:hypothetical protein
MKNCQRTVKFFPIWGLNVRYCGAFNWLKCPSDIMYHKPTTGCQISTLLFGFWETLWISHDKFPKDGKVLFHFGFESKILLVPLTDLSVIGGILYLKPTAVCQISTLIFGFLGGTLWISLEKLPKNGTVLSHLGFKCKVLPGPWTDLSAWVGLYTSNPQQGVKYQLCYLDLFWRIIFISHEKMTQNSKVISHLGFNSRVFPEPLTDIGAWVEFCTLQAHSRLSNINFDIWILLLGEPYIYPMKNFQQTKKFFPSWGLDQRYCPGL